MSNKVNKKYLYNLILYFAFVFNIAIRFFFSTINILSKKMIINIYWILITSLILKIIKFDKKLN